MKGSDASTPQIPLRISAVIRNSQVLRDYAPMPPFRTLGTPADRRMLREPARLHDNDSDSSCLCDLSSRMEGWPVRSHHLKNWQRRARDLKLELHALYLAYQHPGVSWRARIVAACVVGYAFSPIDLIPDPIPILGYVDDIILVPLGIMLALRMIPADIMAECRSEARASANQRRPANWIAAGFIVLCWLAGFALVAWLLLRLL